MRGWDEIDIREKELKSVEGMSLSLFFFIHSIFLILSFNIERIFFTPNFGLLLKGYYFLLFINILF